MSEAMLAAARLYNDPRYFSPSEIRIRNNRIKRQRIVRRQIIVLSILATLFLFVTIFMASSFMADAQSDDSFVPEFKYYKTITVHSGDTIWEIANDNYNANHYDDIYKYIDEIKNINAIDDSDSLSAGEALILPYYSSEFK